MNVKLIGKKAKMPKKAHQSDAGFDLFVSEIVKKGWFKVHYKLGFSCDFPKDMYAEVYSRSSVHKKFLWLSNSTGIIDNAYKGEWQAVFYRIPFLSKNYKVGDACCQAVFKFMQDHFISFEEVKSLQDSDRGNNGFGSSGNN